ncbi:MAG: PIN domain-containing protein [Actinomycetota bacterium]|nr:PIN domain-containing protein [Actinomycetota bacterium]
MSLLVDTSVWSLALRRDAPPDAPEVRALRDALAGSEIVATTGVILQELLQGVVPERTRAQIIENFAVLEYLTPSREDHVAAADVRSALRSAGVQVGTIDALIARLAIGGGHTLLTTDNDFRAASSHISLRLWRAP